MIFPYIRMKKKTIQVVLHCPGGNLVDGRGIFNEISWVTPPSDAVEIQCDYEDVTLSRKPQSVLSIHDTFETNVTFILIYYSVTISPG